MACICLLKKEWGEVFLTLLKDVVKQIINTCNHIMLMNQVNVLLYFGANNLYGWAMSQCFPYSGFKWLNQKEIVKFCLNSINPIVDLSG